MQANEKACEHERDVMEFDVLIVGAGPAGLSAACRLAQAAAQNPDQAPLEICVIEKGSEVGAHILSGAVFEPSALVTLFPDWQARGAPLHTPVTQDEVYYLRDKEKAVKIPHPLLPKSLLNDGNYIISLGNLCRWLAEQAEQLGVQIFPGFAAAEVIYEDNQVAGVITGDMGRAADGGEKTGFMPGMALRAKHTIFAEGCRGHLGKELIERFALDTGKSPQHYGIGLKELWDIPAEQHQPGLVVHGTGWPLTDSDSSGGSFLYHLENGQVVVGLIVDLNYHNPWLSPFDEFQNFKQHPVISQHLTGGKRVSYGARAIAKGGLNSLPEMRFPGGYLVGCDAGTLNPAKIKGSHCAMQSGMLAAEQILEDISQGEQTQEDQAQRWNTRFRASSLYTELQQSRNFGPALHRFGTVLGGAFNLLDQNLFGGKLPLTLRDKTTDHGSLKQADQCQPLDYPKPDGVLSFDKPSSVFLSNTNHEEDQPCHLQLGDAMLPLQQNLPLYAEPAQRYCPAGVYEITGEGDNQALQINAQNCLHCKTCDIKDPAQNIRWMVPEGTGGPNYPNM